MRNLKLVVNEDESLLDGLIRNAVDGIPGPLDWVYDQLGKPDPDEAWATVVRVRDRFRRHHGQRYVAAGMRPTFPCAEIEASVARVGWPRLYLNSNADELRRDFAKCYCTLIARLARDALAEGRLEPFQEFDHTPDAEVG